MDAATPMELRAPRGVPADVESPQRADRTRELEDAGRLLCRACGEPITSRAEQTTVAGSHVHRRTNPAGITFTFGCFSSAPGANVPGPATDESWQPFSAARVVELQASGRPVFIDFTAAWCLTCKVNERVVLETEAIEEAFRRRDVVLLKADWTRQDPEITRALEAFGRTGVPLYVLYTGATDAPPIILPTILTRETLLEALEGI